MNLKMLLFLAGLGVFQAATAALEAPPQYVGRSICTECHAQQVEQWSNSHHDLAMQAADEKTVLGDFNDASLTQFGVTSSFYREGDRFMVRTEGPDGELRDYRVKYTFGIAPLQQYLIEFPGGRLQALSLAWDARPKVQGGQRWFHLYPNEKIAHDDQLHWTRPSQNWNSMCAECHSTQLRKNYDQTTRIFATTWSEIDVSCEACHGPGGDHISWARKQPGWEKLNAGKGLVLKLDERREVVWTIDPETGNATRSRPRGSQKEIEMCAPCHARRSPISKDYVPGDPFMDHYRPQLLDEGMYFSDGQIDDEVYVYGSFLQSRMYHAGVTCSDCHEPHSLALRAPGNGVCLQCHLASKYDRSTHHFHKSDSEGGSCAECHMPPRTYMVVDPRHDHSMRIPRPDLSQKLGTPSACTNCHTDQDAAWAADHFRRWYPESPQRQQAYAEALTAARNGSPGAGELLEKLAQDTAAPAITRATALSALVPHIRRESLDSLQQGLAAESPMLRMAALDVVQQLPPAMRAPLAFPLLVDPLLAMRIEAALALAEIPPGNLSDEQRTVLEKATAEYVEAQQAMAERPEAQSSLGNLYLAQGRVTEAEAAFKAAIELDPAFVPGYVNLADTYRHLGDEEAAERVLRRALEVVPDNASAYHALGLSLVRQARADEAVKVLRLAALSAPDSARYVYVYAVALNSTGQPKQAVLVLQGAHNRFPNNREILTALATFHRDMGNQKAARIYAGKLQAITQ